MPDNSFPASEFDDWADTYDASISTEQFPFEGYKKVLKQIVDLAAAKTGSTVLDLGTGTGNLAELFARQGCELWCTDFSAAMLAKARMKLPTAHSRQYDLRDDWPAALPVSFDLIVSAYVFHHFNLEEKVAIVQKMINHLKPGGKLLIGDIAFPDNASFAQTKERLGDEWEEEYYWIASETLAAFKEKGIKVEFIQVSPSAGIFSFVV